MNEKILSPYLEKWYIAILKFCESTPLLTMAKRLAEAPLRARKSRLHAFYCGMLFTRLLYATLQKRYDHSIPIPLLNAFYASVQSIRDEQNFAQEVACCDKNRSNKLDANPASFIF